MSQSFDSATDEIRERISVLHDSADRMRKEADSLDEQAAGLRAKADRNDRLASEYHAFLPPRSLADIIA